MRNQGVTGVLPNAETENAAPDDGRGGAIDAAGKWVGGPAPVYPAGVAEAISVMGDRSHFVIERAASRWRIIVRRRGHLPRVIDAATRGEANRLRMTFTDDGLAGVVVGAALDHLPLHGG